MEPGPSTPRHDVAIPCPTCLLTFRLPEKVNYKAKSQHASFGRQRLKVKVPTGTYGWVPGICHLTPEGEETQVCEETWHPAANVAVMKAKDFHTNPHLEQPGSSGNMATGPWG